MSSQYGRDGRDVSTLYGREGRGGGGADVNTSSSPLGFYSFTSSFLFAHGSVRGRSVPQPPASAPDYSRARLLEVSRCRDGLRKFLYINDIKETP